MLKIETKILDLSQQVCLIFAMMAWHLETERKFLLLMREWHRVKKPAGILITQGYLSVQAGLTVRVRLMDHLCYLTIKGKRTGVSRREFECEIPYDEGLELLKMCPGHVIRKTRYRIPFSGNTWDVDIFSGENQGLCLAEIELKRPDEDFIRPGWIGREVTGFRKYDNSYLANHPFGKWSIGESNP